MNETGIPSVDTSNRAMGQLIRSYYKDHLFVVMSMNIRPQRIAEAREQQKAVVMNEPDGLWLVAVPVSSLSAPSA